MRILLWHVHGSWTTAFVQGGHDYLVPRLPDRGPDGLGRARTFAWPDSVVEASPAQLRDMDIDVVVLQRPRDEQLCRDWLGRVPGRDLPAVWVEHNAPQGRISEMRHPAADRDDLVVVHVTHFNALFWDCGGTKVRVIEHGVVDPGLRYTGGLPRIGVVVNEPVRRWRVTGTDLLGRFTDIAAIDVFGMHVNGLADQLRLDPQLLVSHEDLPQETMHAALCERRVYLHPLRWTSLGLSLIEAMHLGMPVVALATTEATRAVPPGTGVTSNDPDELRAAVRRLISDPEEACALGKAGRAHALRRYGLGRFLEDWDKLLAEVVA